MSQTEPSPVAQEGKPFIFNRLKEEDNELDFNLSLEEIYNRIRMVDSSEYNKSFIKLGNYKIEFSKAIQHNDQIFAEIKIIKNK